MKKNPLTGHFRKNLKPILLTLAIAAVQGLGFYYLATYVVNYLTTTLMIERGPALTFSAIGLTVYMVLCPIAGRSATSSDDGSSTCSAPRPTWCCPSRCSCSCRGGQGVAVVAGIILLSMAQCLVSVTTVVMLVELFPASSRSSASAIGFNFALAFIAGPGPFIATWIAGATGSAVAPAGYMVLVALLALPVVWKWLPETAGRDISAEHHADASDDVLVR